MNTYLATLSQRQQAEGWSDREMARQMAVAEATWYRIRTGSRGMGTSTLRRAMARFPEYNHLALSFLASDASNRSDYASEEAA